MLQSRRSSSVQRRRVLATLLAALCLNSSASGQTPSAALKLNDAPPQISEPIHSTLEMRVARRPWLLEKFIPKQEPAPSIKMQPPRPPADLPDPPSMKVLPAQTRHRDLSDGWIARGSRERDQPVELTPSQDVKSRVEKRSELELVEPAAEAPPQSEPSLRAPSNGKSDDQVQLKPLVDPGKTATPKTDGDQPLPVDDHADVAEQKSDLPTLLRKAEPSPELQEVKVLDVPKGVISSAKPIKDAGKVAANKSPDLKRTPSIPVEEIESSPETDSVAKGRIEDTPVRAAIRRDYTGYPQEPLRLNNSVRGMQQSMRACLKYYYDRPEIANERSNWGMLHSIMVYGVDTRVIVGRQSYSAIAWIAGNNSCRGQKLLTAGPRGIEAKSGVGLQGHQAQMLAVFSLCEVPESYPLYAGQEKFTVGDVIDAEMAACKSGEELTFTLIALSHYLDTDASWIADDGQRWNCERLIQEELSQPIVGAACGGTHRLMGFAHALRKRRAAEKPITGQWKRAELFVQDFESYCYRLQNRDGSMSTDWFEGREDNGNLDRKIQTTGHMVEWLLTVTPDDQLQNPRLVRAVRYLLTAMYNERDHDWKIGPKGHALRSLAMYYERVYRSGLPWRPEEMARSGAVSHR